MSYFAAKQSPWQVPTSSGAVLGHVSQPSALVATTLGLGIAAAVFAPWFAHLVPAEAAPLGPVLLPMFLAPLLAALLLRLPLAVAVSMATPIVSRMLTGMPGDAVLPGMVLQIALFVVAIRLLRRYHWLGVVPAAYLASLVATALVTAAMPGVAAVSFTGALTTGLPGLAILAGAGLLLHKILR